MSNDDTWAEQAAHYAKGPGNPIADGVGTGLHRWAESMSVTGRRQAARVAVAKLNDWTHGHNEERPSRGELKTWFALLLADRHALLWRANEAGQGAQVVEGLRRELDAVRAQRDDALEEVRIARADAAGCAEEADELRDRLLDVEQDRTRLTKERDRAEQNLYQHTVEAARRYDELDEAYGQAEAERNDLARVAAERERALIRIQGGRGSRWRWDGSAWHRLGPGRSSCSHPGGGAE